MCVIKRTILLQERLLMVFRTRPIVVEFRCHDLALKITAAEEMK